MCARGVQLGRTDSGDLTEPLHGALGYAAPTPFKHPARFILAFSLSPPHGCTYLLRLLVPQSSTYVQRTRTYGTGVLLPIVREIINAILMSHDDVAGANSWPFPLPCSIDRVSWMS